VRFVGDTEKRIKEDFLRILRFFRFAARMDASMDDQTLITIGKLRGGLDQISKERVWLEMSKLFNTPGRVRVFTAIQGWAVSTQIGLPHIQAGELFFANSAESAVALFFKGDGAAARKFCNSWKMSGEETAKIVWIADNFHKVSQVQIEDWLNEGKDREWIVELAQTAFWTAEINELVSHARDFPTTVFPVKGQDLLDAGMLPGKAMGARLQEMRARWVESRFLLCRETLMR
jgi:tRNA nucleotidyltransferase/poly(A) polymerase